MNRQDAEKIITEYLKPIFGFALKRCKSIQDAEDLSQEIVLKSFNALLTKDNIVSESKFIWTVAHNCLSNYYRDSEKRNGSVSIDDVTEIEDNDSFFSSNDDTEELSRVRKEIAYLSKLQRRIVIAYYFENRKQTEIADELGIPLGTVKWHLFEAKKDLKRGMEKMRKPSDLKFNPIKFNSIGVNGSAGKKSPDEFLRSALSQNICYSVRNTAKTINEIADDLGVSPVYIESEAEVLEQYGFLREQKGRYIINFIISEPTSELLTMQDKMYKQAAEIFANELYDTIISSGILDDPNIVCNQSDKPISLTESAKADRNFVLWSLIPYIASSEAEEVIKFDEVATLRPDGGHNIFYATVLPEKLDLPKDYVYMNNWCGPMWNGKKDTSMWQVDSQWSNRAPISERNIHDEFEHTVALFNAEDDGTLSKHDYAWLSERGYIKTNGMYDKSFKSSWQVVLLYGNEIQQKLLRMGEEIKNKHKDEFNKLKTTYVKAALDCVPAHLRKVKEYELQHIFYCDGWFLLHCITALLANGKLKEPTEGQRKALMTVITISD